MENVSTEASKRAWTAADAFDVIDRAWDGAPALLGRGQWRHENRVRLGLLRLDELHPQMVWHGYLEESEAAELRNRLVAKGTLDEGCFDFMFATPWKVAWAISTERLAIYSRRGLCSVVTGDHVERRRALVGPRLIARDEVVDVRGEGGAFRARTRVRLRLQNDRETTIVSAYDFGNWLSDDPWEIYESWPRGLAEEIKGRLGIATPIAAAER